MEPDDFTIGNITISTADTWDADTTYTVDLNTVDTIDLSSLGTDFITSGDPRRTRIRDNGSIPVDIWAKLYNNGIIEDD